VIRERIQSARSAGLLPGSTTSRQERCITRQDLDHLRTVADVVIDDVARIETPQSCPIAPGSTAGAIGARRDVGADDIRPVGADSRFRPRRRWRCVGHRHRLGYYRLQCGRDSCGCMARRPATREDDRDPRNSCYLSPHESIFPRMRRESRRRVCHPGPFSATPGVTDLAAVLCRREQ
jgi:hypothetical protein